MSAAAQNSKRGRSCVTISARHPAFAGHFPNDPLLPGVVVLDKLIQQVQIHHAALTGLAQGQFYLESVKFLHSVCPNDEICFEWEQQGARLSFQIHCQTTLVAQGTLTTLIPLQAEKSPK
jgi:3-hydroxyacyl-[acyl-carrier-protein] dehydratase